MIPTIPRFAAHDRAVPKAYLVARNAFTVASIAMAAVMSAMILVGIANGAWGAADGTGFVIPAWLVIALGCVPPVASVVLLVHLTWERLGDIIGFLTPTGILFIVVPIALAVLYPDPTGVHWDPYDEYADPNDPRTLLGWHWIAAVPQVVTSVALWIGVIRFTKRADAERAKAIAEWKRTYGT